MGYVNVINPRSIFTEHTNEINIIWETDIPQAAYEIQYKFKSDAEWSTLGKINSNEKSARLDKIYDIVLVDFYEIYYRVVLYYDNAYTVESTPSGNLDSFSNGFIASDTYILIFSDDHYATMKFFDGVGTSEYPLFKYIGENSMEKAGLDLLKINAQKDESSDPDVVLLPLVPKDSVLASNTKINTNKGIMLFAAETPNFYHSPFYSYGYIDKYVVKYEFGYSYNYYSDYAYEADYTYAPSYSYYDIYNYDPAYDTIYDYYQYYAYNIYYYLYNYYYPNYSTGSDIYYYRDYYYTPYTNYGSSTGYYRYSYTRYYTRSYNVGYDYYTTGTRGFYGYKSRTGYNSRYRRTYTYQAPYYYAISYRERHDFSTNIYYSVAYTAYAYNSYTYTYAYTDYKLDWDDRQGTSYYSYLSGYTMVRDATGSNYYIVYSYDEYAPGMYQQYVYYPISYYYAYDTGGDQLYIDHYYAYIYGYHDYFVQDQAYAYHSHDIDISYNYSYYVVSS